MQQVVASNAINFNSLWPTIIACVRLALNDTVMVIILFSLYGVVTLTDLQLIPSCPTGQLGINGRSVRVITPYRLYRIITLTVPLDDKDHKTVFSPV